MTAARSGAAFDSMAAEYDRVFSESLIGHAQRQVVWEMLDRAFRPGQHILEINCGTGVDAVHMADRGLRVHACDASAAMVDVARRRLHGMTGVEVERCATEDLADLPGGYEGLLSNFGGLNCVDDLQQTIGKLKRPVRVGGSAVLCFLGPLCAWETLWYLAHGNPRKAFRRLSRSGVLARIGSGEPFRVYYPHVRALARLLAPEFRLVERVGVGVLVPPSYAEAFAINHPRSLALAVRLDRMVARWPLFRGLGDHVLLHFKKVSG